MPAFQSKLNTPHQSDVLNVAHTHDVVSRRNRSDRLSRSPFDARNPVQSHGSHRDASRGNVGATAVSRFAHDFSRVPIFSRAATAATAERSLQPSPGQSRIGIGDNDAGVDAAPARDAGPGSDAGQPRDAGPAVDAEPVPPGQKADDSQKPDPTKEQDAVAPCAIESRTAVHAPDGTPDTRTTVGVCETVIFTIGEQVADWTSSSGWPQARTGRARYEWAAPERPGTSTITATVPATGQTCSLDMEVVAPSGVRLRNVAELGYPAGTAGAGMQLTVRLHPRNVNFGWVAEREDDTPALQVQNYFTRFTAAQLMHHAAPNFARVGWDNALAPDAAGDPQGDTAATVANTLPAPWGVGTYRWNIPVRYRCSNSTHNGFVFTHVPQRFTMEADGTVIVTKDGERVERTP
jgi:hypothetical protein